MLGNRRVKRSGGRFVVNLPGREREVIAHALGELRDMLAEIDPSNAAIARLFPAAYPADGAHDEHEAEYQQYMRDELATSRRAAIDRTIESIGRKHLDEAELMAWMRGINDVRLVLGTVLDLSQDDHDPDDFGDAAQPLLALYGYLSVLLEEIVDALSSN